MQDISTNELKVEQITETTAPIVIAGPNLNVPPPGFETSKAFSQSLGAKELAKVIAGYVDRSKTPVGDLNAIGEQGGIPLANLGMDAILRKINANATTGIRVDQVLERKKGFGSNAREKKPLRTVIQILCAVLEDFMLRILIVASIVTIVVNMIVEEEKSIGKSFAQPSLD